MACIYVHQIYELILAERILTVREIFFCYPYRPTLLQIQFSNFDHWHWPWKITPKTQMTCSKSFYNWFFFINFTQTNIMVFVHKICVFCVYPPGIWTILVTFHTPNREISWVSQHALCRETVIVCMDWGKRIRQQIGYI